MITTSIEKQVATITLNRPEIHNAFNDVMISELTTSFQEISQRDDVRVVLLASTGKSFSAGADMNWMKKVAEYSEAENRSDAMELALMLRMIDTCPKPVIARVQGDAYGGGVGLIAVADIAIAANHSRFAFSEARVGLSPATISPYVVRSIGARAARRYFLSAERFDAEEARRIGLIHQLTPLDELEEVVDEVLSHIVANGPHAVSDCKKLVQDISPIPEQIVDMTVERIANIRVSPEGQEGVHAFLEKRDPIWKESV
jgi:methylglutaconyl-CoA hydratase